MPGLVARWRGDGGRGLLLLMFKGDGPMERLIGERLAERMMGEEVIEERPEAEEPSSSRG